MKNRSVAVFEQLEVWLAKTRSDTDEEKMCVPEIVQRVTGRRTADNVVCIHNAPDDVARCLESIAACTNLLEHRLSLVDDCRDVPARRLAVAAATRLSAQYIRKEIVKDYTSTANTGLKAAAGDYIVPLNSHTIVPPDWL